MLEDFNLGISTGYLYRQEHFSHLYFFVMMTHLAWFPGIQNDTYLP